MSARDQQAGGRGDEAAIEVRLVDRHVRAVVAIEKQRKGLAVADAEERQRGEPSSVIGPDVAHLHAFGGQGLAHESAVVLVADARQHGGLETQPCRADRRVGRRAAQVFAEGLHVLQPAADLVAIEIDAGAAHADQVERPRGHGCPLGAARLPLAEVRRLARGPDFSAR